MTMDEKRNDFPGQIWGDNCMYKAWMYVHVYVLSRSVVTSSCNIISQTIYKWTISVFLLFVQTKWNVVSGLDVSESRNVYSLFISVLCFLVYFGVWNPVSECGSPVIDVWQLKRSGRQKPFQDQLKFKTDNTFGICFQTLVKLHDLTKNV